MSNREEGDDDERDDAEEEKPEDDVARDDIWSPRRSGAARQNRKVPQRYDIAKKAMARNIQQAPLSSPTKPELFYAGTTIDNSNLYMGLGMSANLPNMTTQDSDLEQESINYSKALEASSIRYSHLQMHPQFSSSSTPSVAIQSHKYQGLDAFEPPAHGDLNGSLGPFLNHPARFPV